ncbi:hypothetical protein [Phenylobacterium sp.]|uniref:hypothetical protein n=1 Tax=Phenylobacterium sp. TaxID=1871053 RepID=UPI0027308EFD|nr:hypothetical protein [Phenylobacterium sp.]MDP1872831.1 hypothetical protein [Phenylobacterium sp.]MDP3299685.1 hypothetical protein [Phenylobacterium sp.]
MRTCTVSSIIAALGLALALSACDEQPPKPPFADKSAPTAAAPSTEAASGQGAAPLTLPPPAQAANCCACPPAAAACPDAKPAKTAKAPAKPATRQRAAPVRQAARAPAPRQPAPRHPAPAPRDYAHQAPRTGHQQDYRRYQGPDIATRGGYERRADAYQGHQEQYRGQAYREDRYAYAPPPPPQVRGYAEQHQSYSEHRSYSQQSSGYAHGVAAGPCCAGPPVQAAGRDSGGYLTWPGKRPPAPYY